MDLADLVRAQRKVLGLSQEAIAHRADLSLNLVNKIERGVITDPHISTLVALADALEVPVSDLVGEDQATVIGGPLGEAGAARGLDAHAASEEARTLGARLHGMDPEEWARFVSSLESPEDVVEAFRKLDDERKILGALYAADRGQRPGDKERRIELYRGLRELRRMRQADLTHVAEKLREGDELVQELGKIVRLHENLQEING